RGLGAAAFGRILNEPRDFALGLAGGRETCDLLENLLCRVNCRLDPAYLLGRLASSQRANDPLGTDQALGIGSAFEIFAEELVHAMRQSVGGLVIERIVDRQPLWINALDRRQQGVANALNVGNDLSPDSGGTHGPIVEFSDDRDSVAGSR